MSDDKSKKDKAAGRNPDTGARQHFCPKCGVWYPATSTDHQGH